MWIDSHCHLNHKNIAPIGSPSEIIAAARAQNVEAMLTINVEIASEFETIAAIASAHDNIWCSLGTHPNHASAKAEKALSAAEIIATTKTNDRIIAIGETGLDYHYDFATIPDQKASFIKHLEVCAETGLPVIIHSRDADEDMAAMLRDHGAGKDFMGVMHCFSSGAKLAEEALDMGFHISFSGILTFKSAQNIRDIAMSVPMDKLLVETDAPYLAPMPHRGKTNQPAYVTHTGEFLADLRGVSAETMAKTTKDNFFTLFPKARKTYVEQGA